MSIHTRGWIICCDVPDCDNVFEPTNDITDPDDAIIAAIDAGWTAQTKMTHSITMHEHFCPKAHRIERRKKP